MALEEVAIPIRGINYSTPEDKATGEYSQYMLNVRPFDTLENKIRLGQRPSMSKMFTQQIGGVAAPLVCLITITTVD